jgi:hypothetical protein
MRYSIKFSLLKYFFKFHEKIWVRNDDNNIKENIKEKRIDIQKFYRKLTMHSFSKYKNSNEIYYF